MNAYRTARRLAVAHRGQYKTGLHYHVDLHIEVDPTMTVTASHEIAAQVRCALKTQLPWVADVLVHVEPARSRTSTEPPRVPSV